MVWPTLGFSGTHVLAGTLGSVGQPSMETGLTFLLFARAGAIFICKPGLGTQNLHTRPVLCRNPEMGYVRLSEMQPARENFRTAKDSYSMSLMGLLPVRRELGFTDPRDMIYAHLSFTTEGQYKDLVADYSKTCVQVYEEFAFHEIETSSTCQIISHFGTNDSSRRLEGLVSWAPDWNSLKTTLPIHVEGPVSSALADYHDSGFFGYHHTWVQEPCTLLLLGYVVDSVVRFSIPLTGLKILPQKHLEFSSRLNYIRGFIDTRSEAAQEAQNLYSDIYSAWKELIHDDAILPSEYNDDPERMIGFFRYTISYYNRDFNDAYYSEHRQVIDYLISYFYSGFNKYFLRESSGAPRKRATGPCT